MNRLYSLSDEVLREKLLQHGFDIPITSTTRNVLIKTLRNLMVRERIERLKGLKWTYARRNSCNSSVSSRFVTKLNRVILSLFVVLFAVVVAVFIYISISPNFANAANVQEVVYNLCSYDYKMSVFFAVIGSIGLISVVVYAIYFIYQTTMNVIQSNRDKKDHLINAIITTVMQKAEDDPINPLVVVNHLRDKLLPSTGRSKLEWAWNQAIAYLENNDSRIKFEMGYRNGEDCLLMKWVDR